MKEMYELLNNVNMNLEEYEDIKLSDIENRKTKNNVLSLINESGYAQKRKLSFTKVCACVALVACISSITVAATSGILSTGIKNVFNIDSNKKMTIANNMGKALDMSVEDGGIKVTADAILRDSHQICVIYTITRTDGKSFDFDGKPCTELWFDEIEEINSKDNSEDNGGESGIIEEESSSNSIKFFIISRFDEEIGSKVDIHMANMQFYTDNMYTPSKTIKGNWDFSIPTDFDYEDSTVNLANGQKLNIAGYDTQLESLAISPVGFYFSINFDSLDKGGSEIIKDVEKTGNFILHLKSGEIVEFNGISGPRCKADGTISFRINGCFEEMIPLDEMDKITLCGYEYKIPDSNVHD
ncbi:MAG: DUF4179 domain-containing protein [Lachnospiraceae bacterium]|nr:DUF4179 domain-containing protein [Lachnospiraceae bacterium]